MIHFPTRYPPEEDSIHRVFIVPLLKHLSFVSTPEHHQIHRTCIEFLLTGSAAAAEQTVPKTCPTSCVTTTQQKPDRTIQTHTSLQLSHESYRISGGFPATPSSSSTTTNPSAVRQEANETSDLSRLVFPLVSKLGRRRQ